MSVDKMGRLSSPPDGLLFELLYEPHLAEDRQEVLPYLLRIDAAHILMLARQGILPGDAAARLLEVHQELSAELRAGREVLPAPPSHRGLFWLYEQQYIQRLGGTVGGAAHAARSRNDINAAVARLRMRRELLQLLEDCADLAAAAVAQAEAHAETLMSAFTHLQPAQPSTLGHYLSGVTAEILRTAEWLAATFETLNRSPMGAAAGVGTSFPIDRDQVARWLGFSGVIESSLDAVASRDYVVQVLSGAALLGTTLTRLAQDLQTWASFAFGFLDWPDALVSTSSIMPQKRNAYVLENVRGQAVRASGALVNVLAGLKNTSFSNSVEVSGEATAPAWPALRASRKAVRLTTLLVERLETRPERMRAFLDGAQTTMTALADLLVRRGGLAFRTAHDAVGALLKELPPDAPPTVAQIRNGLAGVLALDENEIEVALDPRHCMLQARYGGGPAPDSVRGQLQQLASRDHSLRDRIAAWRRSLDEADQSLDGAIATFLNEREPR
ncbi:MAG TPA: argininosuccinate lyase [Thermoanaerobaculia bacterium]|nr:argininosuccinate lyase [Thermoanaerobaculia bacterium]